MGTARRTPVALAVACVILTAMFWSVPTGAVAQDGLEITGIAVADESVVRVQDGVTFLWLSDSQTLTVGVESGPGQGEGHYDICLTATPQTNGSSQELGCRETSLAANTTEKVVFRIDSWPDDLVGRQQLSAVVYDGTLSKNQVATQSISLFVMRRSADLDGDGLTNEAEVAAGTDVTDGDTDGDGVSDGLERTTFGTDPTERDTDGDGLDDGTEVEAARTDPTERDTDGDGLDDGAEVNTYGTDPNRPDTDGDGLDDGAEVNAYETDPDNPDTDGDGLDDGAEVNTHETDPDSQDTDGDGLNDALEVHTYPTDPRKADSDTDGLDDGTEVLDTHTDPSAADTDSDGLDDGPEVNAYSTDPNVADTDGDGLNDGPEVHRYETDPTLADTDGDGVADREEVRSNVPFLPGWAWAAVGGLGAILFAGAVLVRRGGVPAWLASLVTSQRSDDADDVGGSTAENADRGGPMVENGDDGGVPITEMTEMALSRKERVLLILEANDGRMKQTAIVEATGWSKATVSRVLNQMAEANQITKINIGRENVVTLPGHEPDGSMPTNDYKD